MIAVTRTATPQSLVNNGEIWTAAYLAARAAEYGFIAILKGKTDKGNTTKDVLGLNRINLLKERSRDIAPYYLYLAIMARDGDQEAKDLLDKACQSHNIFAAFMRSLRTAIVG